MTACVMSRLEAGQLGKQVCDYKCIPPSSTSGFSGKLVGLNVRQQTLAGILQEIKHLQIDPCYNTNAKHAPQYRTPM